jgi:hypothetical protein
MVIVHITMGEHIKQDNKHNREHVTVELCTCRITIEGNDWTSEFLYTQLWIFPTSLLRYLYFHFHLFFLSSSDLTVLSIHTVYSTSKETASSLHLHSKPVLLSRPRFKNLFIKNYYYFNYLKHEGGDNSGVGWRLAGEGVRTILIIMVCHYLVLGGD